MSRLGRPMYVLKCYWTRTSQSRRLLAFTGPVSPSESGLEGLLFCCAVTWKGAGPGSWTRRLDSFRPTEEKAYSDLVSLAVLSQLFIKPSRIRTSYVKSVLFKTQVVTCSYAKLEDYRPTHYLLRLEFAKDNILSNPFRFERMQLKD